MISEFRVMKKMCPSKTLLILGTVLLGSILVPLGCISDFLLVIFVYCHTYVFSILVEKDRATHSYECENSTERTSEIYVTNVYLSIAAADLAG